MAEESGQQKKIEGGIFENSDPNMLKSDFARQLLFGDDETEPEAPTTLKQPMVPDSQPTRPQFFLDLNTVSESDNQSNRMVPSEEQKQMTSTSEECKQMVNTGRSSQLSNRLPPLAPGSNPGNQSQRSNHKSKSPPEVQNKMNMRYRDDRLSSGRQRNSSGSSSHREMIQRLEENDNQIIQRLENLQGMSCDSTKKGPDTNKQFLEEMRQKYLADKMKQSNESQN